LVSYSFLLFSVDVVLNFPTIMLKEALVLAGSSSSNVIESVLVSRAE
jgi:hypothetical protein